MRASVFCFLKKYARCLPVCMCVCVCVCFVAIRESHFLLSFSRQILFCLFVFFFFSLFERSLRNLFHRTHTHTHTHTQRSVLINYVVEGIIYYFQESRLRFTLIPLRFPRLFDGSSLFPVAGGTRLEHGAILRSSVIGEHDPSMPREHAIANIRSGQSPL